MNFLKKLFSTKNIDSSDDQIDFLEGDIFYTSIDNEYHLNKLLVNDKDFNTYHVLKYTPLKSLPQTSEIDNLEVFIYHSPFSKNAFNNPVLLTNKQVKSNDLVGYHEYLRQTQDPNYYIPIANNYYQSGLHSTDKNNHIEAIDYYSKAIDLFPQFFEAIDNRAFCKMDLALWTDAIKDFKLSLQENPNSLLAEFSIGECHFKMGEFQKAKEHFEIANKIDPNNETPKKFLDQVNILLKK